MKKYVAMLLLLVLALCTACGEKPSAQPPKNSLMQQSDFTIADGKVTEKNLKSVSADYKTYYAYTLSAGVESLEEGSGGARSQLTFAQLQKALDCLAIYSKDPGFAFAGPYEQCTFRPEAEWYMLGDTAPGEFQWHFVYSISENTIKPLEGKYTGARSFGVLSLTNIDYYGNITDGTKQGKHCRVFIDK